ncbi:nose resistant to fluoxetine protein 6-like [Brevipalpus obovatus]|uniref:nose resistant to fluoxetine protein 6-like n=1 Tax=Brevipalpus obovatus TaxID=246614 RepID=UPI003D9E243E
MFRISREFLFFFVQFGLFTGSFSSPNAWTVLEKRIEDETIRLSKSWLAQLEPIFSKLSTQCSHSIRSYLKDLKDLQLEATMIYDSSGKIPSGLLSGVGSSLGQFDQCLSIVKAQYCLMSVESGQDKSSTSVKTEALRFMTSHFLDFNVTFGFCLPKFCSTVEVKTIADRILGQQGLSMFPVTVEKCWSQTSREDEKIETHHLIAWTVLAFLMLFNVIGVFFPTVEMTKCFNTIEHFKNLFIYPSREFQYDSLYGLKSLCMFCMIIGHILLVDHLLISQKFMMLDIYTSFIGRSFLSFCPYIPDIFFLLSGFEISNYFILNEEKINWKTFFLSRWLRFSSMIGVGICLYSATYNSVFMRNFGGPLYFKYLETSSNRPEACKSFWTHHLLLVAHLLYPENHETWCMMEDYFLEVDFLFGLLFLVFILPVIRKSTRKTIYICVCLTLMANIILIHSTIKYEIDWTWPIFTGLTRKTLKFLDLIHFKPWVHSIPFFGGVTLAVLKHSKGPIKFSEIKLRGFWLIWFLFLAFTISSGYLMETLFPSISPISIRYHIVLMPLINLLTYSWLVFACCSNMASDWLVHFLSSRFFKTTSKISLSLMFVNLYIIYVLNAVTRNPTHGTLMALIFVRIIPTLFYIYLIGFFVHLTIEAPIGLIIRSFTRKLFLTRGSKKSS